MCDWCRVVCVTSVACRSVVQSFQGLYPVYSLQTAITHTHDWSGKQQGLT